MTARGRPTQADVSFGALGACLVALACAFAVWGIPPIPPAPLVLAGVPSPLTGMTRSFVATARGDLVGAFYLHPLGPLCFAACIAAAVSALLLVVRGRRATFVDAILRPSSAAIAAVAFGAVWIRQIIVFD